MGRVRPAAKPVKQAEEPIAREPPKVSNLYEAGALKGVLDEAAREVVLDIGYEEDTMINNIKLVLGFSAIGAAAYSQFGPGKFPATWWTVLYCVIAYLVLTIAMNLYSLKMEGDAFLVTKPFRGTKGLRMSSRTGRASDEYTLALSDRGDPSIEVECSVRIPELFHADGYLAEPAWRTEVEKLCAAFDQRLRDRAAKKTN